MKAGYRCPAFVFSDGLKGKGRLKEDVETADCLSAGFGETEILCRYAAHSLWRGGLCRQRLVSSGGGMENDEAD